MNIILIKPTFKKNILYYTMKYKNTKDKKMQKHNFTFRDTLLRDIKLSLDTEMKKDIKPKGKYILLNFEETNDMIFKTHNNGNLEMYLFLNHYQAITAIYNVRSKEYFFRFIDTRHTATNMREANEKNEVFIYRLNENANTLTEVKKLGLI